jgi:hypothetical protein
MPQQPHATAARHTARRYLASNAQMQQVANTLLKLMSLPPHLSLHAGKATISISSECDHDRISGLVGLAAGSSSDNRFRYQVGVAWKNWWKA